MTDVGTRTTAALGLTLALACVAAAQNVPGTLRPGAGMQPAVLEFAPTPAELEHVEIRPQLNSCLRRLEDPSYSIREGATSELLSSDYLDHEIYAALAQLQLSAEQRHRLVTVLTERVLNRPRGAVGIRVDTRALPAGEIIVQDLLPELPARDVLEVGDRITHLDDTPVLDWNAFVYSVQQRLPGSKISVTVQRPISGRRGNRLVAAEKPSFEKLTVEIELGSADLLRDPVTGQVSRGPLYADREREAEEARGQYGPRPRQIEIGH